jgi:hypothetical protein
MEIQERKKREEQNWNMEIEKKWAVIEDCLHYVEEGLDGLRTSGMEDNKNIEKIWAEEEPKKNAKRSRKEEYGLSGKAWTERLESTRGKES